MISKLAEQQVKNPRVNDASDCLNNQGTLLKLTKSNRGELAIKVERV